MFLQVCARTFKLSEKLDLLGVTIDSKLYFKFHINGSCNTASQMLRVLI